MTDAATLTPREVAELSRVPKRVIEKAIEERVLKVRLRTARGLSRHSRRMLPIHAVAYATLITRLDLNLTRAHKKHLISKLAHMKTAQLGWSSRLRSRLMLAASLEMSWTVLNDIVSPATPGLLSMTQSRAGPLSFEKHVGRSIPCSAGSIME